MKIKQPIKIKIDEQYETAKKRSLTFSFYIFFNVWYNKKMKYEKINLLKKAKNVCLIAHTEPDADALCSMVVFKNFLVKYFNLNVDIFAEFSSFPQSYDCIVENQNLNKGEADYDYAIMMDCPITERMGKYEKLFLNAPQKFVIDHHATNEFDKSTNYIEVVSSTCEIVFDILKAYSYKFTKKDYGMIYAGIITDTNNLTVGQRSRHTFDVVGECVQNVDSYPIYENFLLNNTKVNMNLLACAIQNIKFFDNDRIIISHITNDQANALGTTQDSYTGIINRLSTINGTRLVAFIYPRQDVYYVSLRARSGYNVGNIAKQHGGGGHDGAAAFLSEANLECIEKTILAELEQELKKNVDKCASIF